MFEIAEFMPFFLAWIPALIVSVIVVLTINFVISLALVIADSLLIEYFSQEYGQFLDGGNFTCPHCGHMMAYWGRQVRLHTVTDCFCPKQISILAVCKPDKTDSH
jgi:hypothetical protein